jgi:hypothetical protein
VTRVREVANEPVVAVMFDDEAVLREDAIAPVIQLRKCEGRVWIALGVQDVERVLGAIRQAFPEEAKRCGLR